MKKITDAVTRTVSLLQAFFLFREEGFFAFFSGQVQEMDP
jgi:hypothetical protein